MVTGKWTGLGIRWEGCWRGLQAIVSSSLCLPRQRGASKWLGCHLQKQFNNSFVYGAGQKGLLWRAGHRWSSEWKRYTHTHTHTPTPMHPHICAHKKGLCWRPARHLGAHHMLRWLTTCSPGPCWETRTNAYACSRSGIFFLLNIRSTFPPQRVLPCILMLNCVHVGCGDKNLPADRNAWRSVFT